MADSATIGVWDTVNFNGVTQGWGGVVVNELAAEGLNLTVFGNNFNEVRGDVLPASDPSGAAMRWGGRVNAELTADDGGQDRNELEQLSFWIRFSDHEPDGAGVFTFMSVGEGDGDENTSISNGIGITIDPRVGAEPINYAVIDANGAQDFMAFGTSNPWNPTNNTWYEMVSQFDIPNLTYQFSILDEAGSLLVQQSGPTRGGMTKLDAWGSVFINNNRDDGGATTRVWTDNFVFETVPEPSTVGLMALGVLGLIRRRRA